MTLPDPILGGDFPTPPRLRHEAIRTVQGHQIVFSGPMPLIKDQYLDCSIYLYASVADAEQGTRTGGSGFLVSVPSESNPKKAFLYAVTNRHVIESGSPVIRLNTADGRHDIIPLDERHWEFHPDGDDLAMTNGTLNLSGDRYKLKQVVPSMMLRREMLDQLDLGLGDDVFIVGRFINHEGTQRNLPTMRFGNIAQMPHEPIRQSRAGGTSYHDQESFLVEARSIGGYSGSPVFAVLDAVYSRGEGSKVRPNKIFFIGVDWGHILDWLPVYDQAGRPTGTKVKSNTGMMGVVPSWKLLEMIESPKHVAMRKKADEEMAARASAAAATAETDSIPSAADVAVIEAATDNPSHKEDFMRLLNAASKGTKPAS